ncbi:MAG: hypothetical protein LBV58_01930 [Acholeplasmatales bacterium]|jgi:hypothetical protein|nr:hypothetical protein [Acholeplasmatales bacterium]
MRAFIYFLKFEIRFNFSRKDKKKDLLGSSITLFLSFFLFSFFLFGSFQFINEYIKVSYLGHEFIDRAIELLSIIFFLVYILEAFQTMEMIFKKIVNSTDFLVMIPLPINLKTFFISKLFFIFLQILFMTFLLIIPQGLIIYTLINGLVNPFLFFLLLVLMIFIVSTFSLLTGIIVSLIYSYIRRKLANYHLFRLIILTIIVGIFFFLYSKILDLVGIYLTSGDFIFFFDLELVNKIRRFIDIIFLFKDMSLIIFSINIFLNFLIIFLNIILLIFLSLFILNLIFKKIYQDKVVNFSKKNRKEYKEKNTYHTLLKKEFINVYRSTNYSFQYFVIGLIVPLICYTMVTISSQIVIKIISLDLKFEIAVFSSILFSSLTNTFSATNVSRDSLMFLELKAMPIKFTDLIYSKVIFSSIISLVSLFITSIVYFFIGISFFESLIIFIGSILFSIAQILLSTKLDLMRPLISKNNYFEISESNNNISFIIFMSLLISIILGILLVFLKVLGIYFFGEVIALILPHIVLILVTLTLSIVSFFIIRKNLEKNVMEVYL